VQLCIAHLLNNALECHKRCLGTKNGSKWFKGVQEASGMFIMGQEVSKGFKRHLEEHERKHYIRNRKACLNNAPCDV
jgi:hypothetical protein